MIKASTSIFTRILVASLLPFTVAFLAVLILLSQMFHRYDDSRVKETVSFFAVYATEKITDTLSNLSTLVKLTADSMDEVVEDSETARDHLRNMLFSLIQANPEIYCGWFVFAEGTAASGPGWFIETYLKRNGQIVMAPSETEELLTDPEHSPWHVIPFQTGKPYQDAVDTWDYGMGDGIEYCGTIAYPIFRDGEIIGTVGIDIRYENAFQFLDEWQIPGQQKIMLFASTGIVLYSDKGRHTLQDFHSLGYSQADMTRFEEAMEENKALMAEIRSPFTGLNSLISLSPVAVPNAVHKLFLYLEHPTQTLYQNAHSLIKGVFAVSLAGLAATAVAAFLATRSIARPVRRLTLFATKVAKGDFTGGEDGGDAPPMRGKGDEVDLLGDSIMKMVDQLHQTHALKLAAVGAEYEKKKMEAASQEQSQFFANMSHEIRTPMNAITGISELMLSEPLSSVQRDRVTDIRSAAQSLLVLINDILDISRIESGKFKLVETDFDFQAMLHNVNSICQFLATEKRLDFRQEEEGDVPRCLYGDEGRLKQVLLNILSNAIKFTKLGGVIFKVTGKDGRLRFDVEDSGIGIKDEDKAILFNAFKQVDQLKHRHVKGTGLGLSITKSLVEMMGGKIWFTSEYGKGSIFHVDLPLAPGDEAKAVKEVNVVEVVTASDARVLVVDDNLLNLKVAKGLIGMHGIRCDLAKSGMQAFDMVLKVSYDLVFMDHMMPEMDGVETTQKIRELGGKFCDLPIVALTANAFAGAREELIGAGMDDYLSKPIQRQELNAVLAKWLPKGKEARKRQ